MMASLRDEKLINHKPETNPEIEQLRARIAELEAENGVLRDGLNYSDEILRKETIERCAQVAEERKGLWLRKALEIPGDPGCGYSRMSECEHIAHVIRALKEKPMTKYSDGSWDEM